MTPTTTPIALPPAPDIRPFLKFFFDLDNDQVLKTIELCQDTTTSNTLWAHSFLIPENRGSIRYKSPKDSKGSNSFKNGNLFTDMNWIKSNEDTESKDTDIVVRKKKGKDTEPYTRMGQWKTARFLLGHPNITDKYFCAGIPMTYDSFNILIRLYFPNITL